MLDVHRLRLLLEFAQRGTIAATAAALGYTPSAVSQQLATLEREAGTALLDRTPRAAELTETDIRTADCILTMTALHRQSVLDRFPEAAGKLHMLSQAARGTQEDVADAFGAPLATYERLVTQLDALVADALDKLAMV